MSVSQENIGTYPDKLEVPGELMEAVMTSDDSTNLRENAKATYTNDCQHDDTSSDSSDDNRGSRRDDDASYRDDEDSGAYVIDGYAVVDSRENVATSPHNLPDALRKLSAEVHLGTVDAAETALRHSKPLPGGAPNAMVIPHGDILSDFHNDDAWVGAFVHLHPEGCGGPEDPSRQRSVSFRRWGANRSESSRLMLAE